MAVKDSEVDNLESDLEEGEVPKFEMLQSGSTEDSVNVQEPGKINCFKQTHPEGKWDVSEDKKSRNTIWQYHKPSRYVGNSVIDYARNRIPGAEPFSSEDEYAFEEEKVIGKRMMPKNVYGSYGPSERRSMYMPPYQSTYGSVEDIMTKIGRTLGRNNINYYYNRSRRISRDPRHAATVNKGHASDIFLESAPVSWKSIRNDTYKRRRYEINSDFEDETRERGNPKNRLLSSRKRMKDSKKKKKQKYKDFDDEEVTKIIRKCKNMNKFECDFVELRKKRLEMLQAKDVNVELVSLGETAQESSGELVKNVTADGSYSLANSRVPLDGKAGDCHLRSANNFIESKNGENFSGSPQTDVDFDEDEDDDDIELIKLRLIALTSNKKKDNAPASDVGVEDFAEKPDPELRNDHVPEVDVIDPDLVNDAELTDEPASAGKCTPQEDIDRNELLLRAEALKTALLKKHKHRIEKQRNVQSNMGDIGGNQCKENSTGEDNMSESIVSSQGEAKLLGEDIELRDQSDMEMDETVGADSFNGSEDHREDHMDGLKSKEGNELHEEDGVSSELTNSETNCSTSSENCDPVPTSACEVNKLSFDAQNVSKENQHVRKKLQKKKRKRSSNGREAHVKENKDGVSERHEEDDTKLRTQLLNDLVKKKTMQEHEKKSVLVDSLQMSNILPSSTTVPASSRQQQELKQFQISSNSEKVNNVTKNVPKVKPPTTTELQRIIVHLGSDSSDEEYVTQSNVETKSDAVSANASENVNKATAEPQGNQNRMVDYEKNVDLLLEAMRRGIEEKAVESSKGASTPQAVYNHLPPSQRLEYMRLKQKIAEREKLRPGNRSASVAVVPGSKRSGVAAEERRNGEIQGNKISDDSTKNFTAESFVSNNSKVSPSGSGSESKNVLIRNEVNAKKIALKTNREKSNPCIGAPPGNSAVSEKNEVSNFTKVKVGATHGKKDSAPSGGLEKNCTESRAVMKKRAPGNGVDLQKRILERRKILTQNRLHLERLKSLWKSIKVEKMIEEKYEKEIKRLKSQQNIFELKVNQQRLKIKKLADETKLIYEAFQKNNKGVEGNGKKKATPTKENKAPSQVARDVEEAREKDLKETADETDNNNTVVPAAEEAAAAAAAGGEVEGDRSKIETSEDGIKLEIEKKMNLSHEPNSSDELKEYKSPLDSISAGCESGDRPRVDPNTIMCQYDLLGKCNDEECLYQHWRTENT